MTLMSTAEGFTVTAGGPARTFATQGAAPVPVAITDGVREHTLVPYPDVRVTVSWEMLQFQRSLLSPLTLTTEDFTAVDVPAPGTRASEVTVVLRHDPLGLTLRITHQADPARATLTKHVTLTADGAEPLRIEDVVLDAVHLEGQAHATSGFGQPLVGETWWAGVRHPSAVTRWSAGVAELSLEHVGRLLLPGESWSAPEVVWGFASRGEVTRSFFAFLDTVRARPVRRCVSINSWYDLQGADLTEAAVSDRLARFEQIMTVERDTPPDVYVIDDYWDDRQSAWEVDRTSFPHGFAAVEAAAERTSLSLGLWFGPVGGYHEERSERVEWYREHGYEVSLNGEYLCLGGAKYHAQFVRQLEEKLDAHRFGYLKLDGLSFTCLHAEHGHEPGAASRLHLVESLIDVLDAARRCRPEVFLSVTTGMWLSPWWLQWADALFIGGDDYNWDDRLPAIEPRDSATTYRDGVMYDDFVAGGDVFPISSLMSMGLIKGDLQRLGGPDESRDAWHRDVVMEVSRGVMQTELYVSPDALSDGEWDDLCSALRWARRNDDVLLAHGEMILGDPREGEAYGYAHRGETRSVVTVRNPSLTPQRVTLDAHAWMPRTGDDLVWREIYPGHRPLPALADRLVLDLGPNAVIMLEAGPAAAPAPGPEQTTASTPAGSDAATVRLGADDAGCRLTVELGDEIEGTIVLIAEGLARTDDGDADEGADVWRTSAAEGLVDRAEGPGWSVLRCTPQGGRTTAVVAAPRARVSAWLWTREPLDGDGTGAGPFAGQDHRVAATLLWSGVVEDGTATGVGTDR